MKTYKLEMIDGWVSKKFIHDIDDDSIEAMRTWLNICEPFINIDNTIVNLRYVKRIRQVKRFIDYIPNSWLEPFDFRKIFAIIGFIIIITFMVLVLVL